MKIKHLKRYFIGIAMTAFLGLLAGNAFGDKANPMTMQLEIIVMVKTAIHLPTIIWSCLHIGRSRGGLLIPSSRLPTHRFRVWLHKLVLLSTLSLVPESAYATAASFTVAAGNTQRVFIVPTNHATINSTLSRRHFYSWYHGFYIRSSSYHATDESSHAEN